MKHAALLLALIGMCGCHGKPPVNAMKCSDGAAWWEPRKDGACHAEDRPSTATIPPVACQSAAGCMVSSGSSMAITLKPNVTGYCVSGTTEPKWPKNPKVGDEVKDGNCVWMYIGLSGEVKP